MQVLDAFAQTSGEGDENSRAARRLWAALWELRAPHFMHEFVRQLLARALAGGSVVAPQLLALLAFLAQSGLVSSTQLRLGVARAEPSHSEGEAWGFDGLRELARSEFLLNL